MLVVFIVDGDFEHLYFTTSDKYSELLKSFSVNPDRAKYKTIPYETIMLILDNQVAYIKR